MALTLRLGLLQYGHIRRTFSYNPLFRALGNAASNRIDSSPSNTNLTNNQTGDLRESTKITTKIHSFPNEELKKKANEEFRKSQARLFTLPNILTFSRMATAPVIGYCIWNGMHSYALTCFAFAAVTDLLDGFIARQFNQKSDVGVIIDPLADKLLLTTCFIAMYNTGLIPLWLMKGLVLRDVLILLGGAAMRYGGLGKKLTLKNFFDFKNYPTMGFEPTFISKCSTALQCTLIIVHLSTNHLVGIPTYDWSIFGLQALTAFTSIYSFGQYFGRLAHSKFPTSKPNRMKG